MQCEGTTPLDSPIIPEQQIRWEQLCAFHANNKQWPMGITPDGIEGGSPLVTMMKYSSSAATWLSTYTWMECCSHTPTKIDHPMAKARPTSLSQAKWNHRKEAVDHSPNHTSQLKAGKSILRSPPDTPQNIQETASPWTQWEQMQMFYSSICLWPAQEGHNPTQMEGGSPILWTMLHPPSAKARLQTYAWNGHLENFMPWTIGHIDGTQVRPPLVLRARWNIRHSTDFGSPIHNTTTQSASTTIPVISRHSGSLGTTIYRLIVAILFLHPPSTPGPRGKAQHPIPTTI